MIFVSYFPISFSNLIPISFFLIIKKYVSYRNEKKTTVAENPIRRWPWKFLEKWNKSLELTQKLDFSPMEIHVLQIRNSPQSIFSVFIPSENIKTH